MSGANKRRRLLDDSASGSSSEVASFTSVAGAAPPAGGEVEVVPMMAATPPPPASQQQQQQQQRQTPLSEPPSIKRSPFPTPSSSSSSSAQAHRPFASAATMGTTLFHVLCCLFALVATSPSLAAALESSSFSTIATGSTGSTSTSSTNTSTNAKSYQQYKVDVPAFRFILRPVPESFAASDARQILEVAQDVAKAYIVHALERTAYHTNNRYGMADVRVDDVQLDYEDWFSYSRRLRLDDKNDGIGTGADIGTTSASGNNSNNGNDHHQQRRHLQGRADYAVIESTLPVGGTVTFRSPNPAAVPTRHDVYLLLTYAFFPEGMAGDNNDGGSGGGGGSGLTSALVGRLGYSPSLTGTFFAVAQKDRDIVPPGAEEEAKKQAQQQQEQQLKEQAKGTDAPTSAPTAPVAKVDDDEEEEDEQVEPEIIVISPLPPNSTSVAPVQPNVDNDVFKTTQGGGGEQDDLLTTQSVDGEKGTTAGGDPANSNSDNTNNTNTNTAALATGIVLGCLAVVVMGAYYVRSRRRNHQPKMREALQSFGGKHGDASNIIKNDLGQGGGDDDDYDYMYDEERGGQKASVYGPILITPQKSKAKPKSKSNYDDGDDDDDDEDGSHRTAPMTPSPFKSSSPVTTPIAPAAFTTRAASNGADANEIVEDLTRDEAELENLRRQKEFDQSWLSDGLQRPAATGVAKAPDAGELAAAMGATAAAAAWVASGARANDASHDNEDDDDDDSSASDSHADSSTAEVATVASLATVSLTPSDSSALQGNRDSSFTIMKDQLIASGGGDPFGETGHESQKGGAGAVSHQVPVPSINFSSFKRKEKNIHLRPNCLTVEGVVGSDAVAIAPEPEDENNDAREEEALPLRDDNAQDVDEDEESKEQDVSTGTPVEENEFADGDHDVPSSNDDSMFIVSSPSSGEADDGKKISPSLLDATPLNPGLKLVEPKILSSAQPSQESTSKLSGVPPPISEDKVTSVPTSAFPPLPDPVPLKDVGQTSLDRPVDFDTPSWTPQNDDNLSSSSSVGSDNDPFVTSDSIKVNDEEFLMDSSPKKGTTYQMMPISDSSFDYEGLGTASSAIGSAFGKGLSHPTKETGGEDDTGGDSLL